MVDQSSLLNDWTSGIEDCEVWNAANVESRRQVGVAFGVNLENHGLACHVRGSSRHLRSRHAAGSAPGCPKVNQHRNPGIAENLVEELRIGFQGFIYRGQGSLAGSAMSGIRQMSGWNTVFTSATLAGSNHRHTIAPSLRRRAKIRPTPSFIKCSYRTKVAAETRTYLLFSFLVCDQEPVFAVARTKWAGPLPSPGKRFLKIEANGSSLGRLIVRWILCNGR
jgi:hypothetical protein